MKECCERQSCHPQGIASTPFLAGLDRTMPQLTPGISPEALAIFQAALRPGAMLASAEEGSDELAATAPQTEALAQPKEAAHSSPSATDLARPKQDMQSPIHAASTAAAANDAAWEGLLDLSPMPGIFMHATNMAFLESPDMDVLSTLCQVSPMAGSSSKPTPVLFNATSAAMQDMTQHASAQAPDSVLGAAQKVSLAGHDPRLAALQDEESVGSASPADTGAMQRCSEEAAAASDTGASAVRTRAAPTQVTHLQPHECTAAPHQSAQFHAARLCVCPEGLSLSRSAD